MTRRWTARIAALAAGSVLIAAAVIGSWLLFDERETPRRSAVAGSQTVRASAPAAGAGDGRLLGTIEDAKRTRALRRAAETTGPSVGDVLTYFDVLMHGPRSVPATEPTVGEVPVFFHALLAEPGPVAPQPSVADTLIFFHALLYGGDAAAASAAAAQEAPPPVAPVSATPIAPRVTATPAPPPPPPPVSAPPSADGDVWTESAFTQAVWDGVNAERARHGLAAVALESRLHIAAANYAIEMAEQRWFSHTGPDGSSFVDRIVAAGFPFTVQVGEVLAMGSHGWPAPKVVQAWMDSPPHREQLLSAAYTWAGLECAFSHESGALMVRCAMEFAAG